MRVDENNFIKALNNATNKFLEKKSLDINQFYQACRTYLNIVLNADYFKSENGVVKGLYFYNDIDAFILLFNDLFILLNREDQELLFDHINDSFIKTATSKEIDSLPSGMVRNTTDKQAIGYYGTYYVCERVPEETVASIKKRLFEKAR